MGEGTSTGVVVAAQDEWVLVEQVILHGRRAAAAEVLFTGTVLGPQRPAS